MSLTHDRDANAKPGQRTEAFDGSLERLVGKNQKAGRRVMLTVDELTQQPKTGWPSYLHLNMTGGHDDPFGDTLKPGVIERKKLRPT